jgi:uncharacterized protein (TIGR02001 family)
MLCSGLMRRTSQKPASNPVTSCYPEKKPDGTNPAMYQVKRKVAPGLVPTFLLGYQESTKMKRNIALAGMAAALATVTTPALAVDLSANIGYNSEYIFRGIPQKSSSAFGGLDLSAGGFYLGTWGADVGDGLEIDYYGGYGFEVGDFNFGVGGTIYTYTSQFDDTYQEVNLSAGWKFLTFDAAIGSYDNFGGPRLHYQFYTVKAEYEGFYGRVGWFADDFEGTYVEGGYGNTLTIQDTPLFDYAFAVIYSDATLLGGESDTNFVFTLSKTFDF